MICGHFLRTRRVMSWKNTVFYAQFSGRLSIPIPLEIAPFGKCAECGWNFRWNFFLIIICINKQSLRSLWFNQRVSTPEVLWIHAWKFACTPSSTNSTILMWIVPQAEEKQEKVKSQELRVHIEFKILLSLFSYAPKKASLLHKEVTVLFRAVSAVKVWLFSHTLFVSSVPLRFQQSQPPKPIKRYLTVNKNPIRSHNIRTALQDYKSARESSNVHQLAGASGKLVGS